MNSTQKLHFAAYLTMTVLTLILAVASVIAAVSGSIDILTGGLATVVFLIFAVFQIGCLAIYQPALTPYKIGFYLMHVGLLILLAGLAAYELAGSDMTVQVPVNEGGAFYSSIQNEDGEAVDLGFGFKIKNFRVDKYESGSDKYYRADVVFTDPTTLRQEEDYLEVNRTLRREGWKLYLMDYSDGLKSLSAQGLTADSFYEQYSANGNTAGADLLSLIYQDVVGVRYSYFLYDEANSYFTPLSRDEVALLTGNIWGYTVEEDNSVEVYLTRKDGSFTETLTASGSELLSHVANTYPDARVSYYTIDRGIVTWLHDESVAEGTENPVATYDSVFAGIHKSNAGVSVYVMAKEFLPHHSFTSTDGGSSLLAEITSVCGKESDEIAYMLYSPRVGGYVKASEEEIEALSGEVHGYAMNMGGKALIYVHPLALILLIKNDPGEWATIAGMVMVMLGGILMCLVRGRKKPSPAQATQAEPATKKTAVAVASPQKQTASQKSTQSGKSKGGKK